LIFVTAGLAAVPALAPLRSLRRLRARWARSRAVVTKPFAFEGKRRMQQAERGISELMESIDTNDHHS